MGSSAIRETCMTTVRLALALREELRVELDTAQAHHLTRVLRFEVGASVRAVDTQGRCWSCHLVSLSPCVLEVDHEIHQGVTVPNVSLEVWLPLLKGGRSDDLFRMLTEMGVSRFVPYVSARTVARPPAERANKKLERWKSIVEEATRQCRRTDIPEILQIVGLPDDGPGVFFWEHAEVPAPEVFSALTPCTSLRVLVGPEGGLSVEEASKLATQGWMAASLGTRTLRAETAVLVSVALSLSALGEPGYGHKPESL
jgi:16S rRNA (uracil1498-N3)-methyltransferase